MYKQCVSSVIVLFWCQWNFFRRFDELRSERWRCKQIFYRGSGMVICDNIYNYTSYRRLHLNQTSNAQLWHFELVEACSLNLMINVDKLCCNLVYFVYWNFDINLCQRTNGKFLLKIHNELTTTRAVKIFDGVGKIIILKHVC